jgi:hypothetical protein
MTQGAEGIESGSARLLRRVLTTFGRLICFGFNLNVMAELLNNAVSELKGEGKSPSPHSVLIEVVERFTFCRRNKRFWQ